MENQLTREQKMTDLQTMLSELSNDDLQALKTTLAESMCLESDIITLEFTVKTQAATIERLEVKS